MIGRMRPFYQAHWDISKDIKHVWLLICTYYIAWIFQWIIGGEGRGKWWDRQYRVWIPQCAAPLDVIVTYARDSFVDSPSVLRPGWHMQETALWIPRGAFCPLEGGGPDTLAQTHWHQSYSSSLWHCLGHSQASLQCHFSRCKVVLCLEDDVLYQVHRVDQGLCSVFIKGVVPPWGDLCVLWHPSEDVDLAHRKILCHFQAKWVISRTGQSSICERIHLTDDTPLCMRHLNRIWMVMQRFNTYEFAIIGRERL